MANFNSNQQKPFNHLKGIHFGIGSDGTFDRAEFKRLKTLVPSPSRLAKSPPFD